jgi:Fic family protein
MVYVKTIKQNDRQYYALVHTLRDGPHTITRTKHLGRELPTSLEAQIEDFNHELFMETWEERLRAIKQKHQQTLKTTPPSAITKNNQAFAIRFTYDSNRIEGSTLTHRETAQLLVEDQAPHRPLVDVLEAKNHYILFKEMKRYAETTANLDLQLVLHWHQILFKDSDPDIAGVIRKGQVKIAGSDHIPPAPEVLGLHLDEFFQWYQEAKDRLHPVELAALVLYKYVWIHPHWDGNGRMARMLMNFVLYSQRYPMYNLQQKDRTSYYRALKRADITGDPYQFVRYFTRKYVKSSFSV